jgi:peptidoglycan/LPS O-acetylase OafA/YrhL
MPEKKRNVFIDLLRGISMGTVISLHALANYLNDPFLLKLWDYQQFAVQIFVFCSAYLFFSYPPTVTFVGLFPYFMKRFWRIYQPYLIYLVFFFLAVFLLKPASFSWKTIYQSLTLQQGGVDIGWLVLLFIQFILVFPAIHFFRSRSRFWFYATVFVIVYSAIFFFFLPFPYHWRYIMWLTWSFMAVYAIFFIKNEDNTHARDTSYMVAAAVFIMIVCIQALYKETLKIYPNKYPPNIILLSYGVVWIGVFDFLHRHGFFERLGLVRPLSFMSRYSYSLFFIHYLIIYIMNTGFQLHKVLPWWGYWLTLFPLSIGVQIVLNKLSAVLKPSKV